jgi:hypothetical protein
LIGKLFLSLDRKQGILPDFGSDILRSVGILNSDELLVRGADLEKATAV